MFKKPNFISDKDEIESKLSSLDIYQHYIDNKITKIPFKTISPFRKEEKNPSFSLYKSKNNKILWKDFTLNESGDVYSFVMKLHGISFAKAIMLIKDNILNHNGDILLSKQYKTDKNNISIQKDSNVLITPHYYNEEDIPLSYYNYWDKYKVINKNILDKNKVSCAKYIYFNNYLYYNYKPDDIIIVYKWKRKNYNKIYYKIYKPMNKTNKWLSNFRGSSKWLVHGLNDIDISQHYIIITKSVKDKMVLEGLGFNAISIQNEGISIPLEIINYLRSLYNYIYVLYDNDYNKSKNWGQLSAKKLISTYPDLINIKINGIYRSVDISDYIEKYDIDKSKGMMRKLISI